MFKKQIATTNQSQNGSTVSKYPPVKPVATYFPVSPRQVTELFRDGKGDQVVLTRQPLPDLTFCPLLTFVLLTMRAV